MAPRKGGTTKEASTKLEATRRNGVSLVEHCDAEPQPDLQAENAGRRNGKPTLVWVCITGSLSLDALPADQRSCRPTHAAGRSHYLPTGATVNRERFHRRLAESKADTPQVASAAATGDHDPYLGGSTL
jgi:hypothetical protein